MTGKVLDFPKRANKVSKVSVDQRRVLERERNNLSVAIPALWDRHHEIGRILGDREGIDAKVVRLKSPS